MPFKKGDPNCGRKTGAVRKGRAEFLSLIHKQFNGPKKLLDKLEELINGVTVMKQDSEGGVKIYEKPPDREAITYILDQAYGKAKQSMEIETRAKTIEEELAELPE